MKKIFLTLGAAILGLTLPGSADAHSGHAGHERHREAVHYRGHGVRFSGGYYYPGHVHHHWTRIVWDGPHHRYIYWDPYLSVYFYWYAPGNCYYPITYSP
jgi:hypothetical protein